MYIPMVLITFITSSLILLTGNLLGVIASSVIIISGMLAASILSLVIFYEVALCGSVCSISLYKWVDTALISVDIGFHFDTITSVMLVVVCIISTIVHLYSLEYMSEDPGYIRYMSYLSLFTFFMIVLVTADNLVQLFMGWEGVGLSSYLLISFWYTRTLANKAAIKAMLTNRIGDICLLISISIIFSLFSTSKYNVIFSLLGYYLNHDIYILGSYVNALNVAALFLFFGAMGKSAQLGLHIWLPDAMEGPTPVSALIHAATMVTAGVFLVIRCSFLFERLPNVLLFVGIIGGLTCFFSAVVGAFQFDIKKIVAYSTCSQLGYMFFSCALSNYNVALFHLFNHAFFKALLFLSMGSIIHAVADEQDFRRMGGLLNILPFTYTMVMIGSLSLLAIPFLTGYYSKDFLLEFAIARYNLDSVFLYTLGVFAAFFTAFYSTRLLYWVFLAPANFYKSLLANIHEPGLFMYGSMFFLSICSIFVGYCFSESFIGIGSSFWGNSIFILTSNYSQFDAEFSLLVSKYLPLLASIMGVVIFYITINYYYLLSVWFFEFTVLSRAYKFANKAMAFDYILVDKLFSCLMGFSYMIIYKYVEKGLFEYFGPLGLYSIVILVYNKLSNLNTGLIFNYIYYIIICLFFLLLVEPFIPIAVDLVYYSINHALNCNTYVLLLTLFFFWTIA